MPAVTERPVSLYGDTVWVEWTFDDATLVLAQVRSRNLTGSRVGRVRVTSSTGAFTEQSIPVGDNVFVVPGLLRVDRVTIYATA